MPKGVEHVSAKAVIAPAPRVPKSEMPKGVEHGGGKVIVSPLAEVPKSEMPKGVEHWISLLKHLKDRLGAEVRDAERR